MADSERDALEFIGRCLAPLEDSNLSLLEQAAKKVRDWERMLLLCGTKHVTPVVYARLRDTGLLELAPPEIRERFEKLYVINAMVNSLRLHQCIKVTSILRERGVKALYFKGSSMVMAGDYPDPGHRMFSDVDLLKACAPGFLTLILERLDNIESEIRFSNRGQRYG